jgi:major type 1 subunit fimbrin (pilin)
MKKTLLSAALVAVMGVVAFAPQSAKAADGTITFNGLITAASCTITGGGAATGTGNVSVTLPTVSATALQAAGSTAGDTKFSLVLSGGAACTNGQTASLWVETTQTPALDTTSGALKNQTGSATAVEVRMVNPANNQPIKLGVNGAYANGATVVASSNQPAATITGNTATLSYMAQYLNPTTAGAVTAGTVATYLTYSMAYN